MKLLLKTFCFSVLLFFSNSSNAQKQQSVTVVRQKTGAAIIEFKKTSIPILGGESYESDEGKYWITAQTNINLQMGLKKVLKWAKLNEEHKQEFEKEVMRIRFTEKKTYEFYRKYIPEFSTEAILSFQGHEDGSFSMSITVTQDATDITLTTYEGVDNLISLLQGKSVNDVDKLFN